MSRTLLSILAATLVTMASPGAQSPQTPDALARQMEKHYQGVQSFKADFVQTYIGGVLRLPTKRGEGTVVVKKPGRMRWEWTKPERQLLVSNGVKIHNYYPDENTLQTSDAPSDAEAPTALLFLAGKGDVARDFTASHVDSPRAGTVALKLTPRGRQADFEHIVLVLDQTSLQIREMTTLDLQGAQYTIVFSNMKENPRISDSTFAFTPPKGVEVIAMEGVRRK